jgi:hypothetical protein
VRFSFISTRADRDLFGKEIPMRRFIIAPFIAALASSASAQIVDDFDSHIVGPLVPQGGWAIWYTGGADGAVVAGAANSPPNFMAVVPGTDVVQTFAIAYSDGTPDIDWIAEAWTFVPPGPGDGSFIMMNQYGAAATDNWSVQIRLNGDPATPFPAGSVVESQFDGAVLPIIVGAWVRLRVEIDFDTDTVNSFYGGVPLGVGLTWTGNVSGGGLPTIECIDLYSATVAGMGWDDITLLCPGDLNADAVIDLIDLATMLASFGAPVAKAKHGDIDGDGIVGLPDLTILLSSFGTGC